VLKNGFYNTAAGVVRMGLAVLTIPLLIHFIGIEEYGLWTLVSAIVGIVTLAEAGLSTATTVFVSQDLGQEDKDGLSQTLTATLGAMLILATLGAIVLWVGSTSIVGWFPNLKQAQQITAIQTLQIGAWVVWTRLFQQILIGVEQAYQRYGSLNLLNTAQSILLSLGLLAVAWSGGRTIALMQWQAVVSILSLSIHSLFVRSLLQKMRLSPNWNWEKGLAVGRYSRMIWLISLGTALFNRVDRLIVGGLLGTQALGIYAAITDIATQINSLSALPVQPLLPHLSSFSGKHLEQPDLTYSVKQALQLNGVIALGLGATLITLSSSILTIVFPGEAIDQYILPFCIAISIYSLYSLNAVGYYILLGTNSTNTCTAIVLASGALSLTMIAIGAHYLGLLGAIFGNVGYLTTCALALLGLKRLSIPTYLWIKWLKFPLIWFLLVILSILFLPKNWEFGLGFSIVQILILLRWFSLQKDRLLLSSLV